MWSRASNLLAVDPVELLDASAKLPVVGPFFGQLSGYTAIGMWAGRHAPGIVGAISKSWTTPNRGFIRQAERARTRAVSDAALRGLVPDADLDIEWPRTDSVPPVLRVGEHLRNRYRTSVRYGDDPEQVLDVWRRKDLSGPAPVMIFVPGGAWVHGGRILQGYALMSHLAEMGWVCLSVEYRVAPGHPWPRHIRDVKAAIAWARANVDRFGGDRGFVTIAGASAGGHLAALAGLTPGNPVFETELAPGSDTSVDAVVGIYGRYDWEDRSTPERVGFMDFLERVIVKQRVEVAPELYHDSSPIALVHADAPPFFVIHGSGDNIIPVQQARDFVAALRSVSTSMVGYAELPGAGHGFDMTDGVRTPVVATAVGLFLEQVRRQPADLAARTAIWAG